MALSGSPLDYYISIKVVLKKMKLQQYLLYCVILAVALAAVAIPVSADLKTVQQGGTVFIGEQGLDITNALNGYTQVAYWAPGTSRTTEAPTYVKIISVPTNFPVTGMIAGEWWQYTPGVVPTTLAFVVEETDAGISLYDLNYITPFNVTDKSARIGDLIDFEVISDLYLIQQRDPGYSFNFNIVVENPGGVTYSYLYVPNGNEPLTFLQLDSKPWYWSSGNGIASDSDYAWKTNEMDSEDYYYYPPGTYSVYITCNQNGLNYASNPVSLELYEDKLDLTVDPGAIVRGNKTYTTITGVPNAWYFLWVKDCSGKMTGYECDQPPMMTNIQADWIHFDPYSICVDYEDCYYIKEQMVECSGCLKTIYDTVPHYPNDGKYYYAFVQLDDNGERTIEWQTNVNTKPGTYIIRAQSFDYNTFPDYDPYTAYVERPLTVNKGVVTFDTYIYGQINSSAYLGETIKIKGTNTDSRTTYLFITGPCQDCGGARLESPNTAVINDVASSFTRVPVNSDGTWEYIWYTKYLKIDLGDYYIYASSKPNDAPALEGVICDDCSPTKTSCAAWIKKPFVFLKPTIIATLSPKVLKIECCDPVPITVTGHATGIMGDTVDEYYDPVPIGYWVFGENKVAGQKYIFNITNVDCPGGTFSIDLSKQFNTLRLVPGTYTVVIQHPMYNHVLDIVPEDWIWLYPWWDYVWTPDQNRDFVVTATPVRWSKLFVIDGPDRLVGAQALAALLNGFADPNIDDETLVLTFKVESNTAIQADFSGSPVSGSAPLNVQFTDISTGTPTGWLWTFGDGYTSTEQNPTHTYTEQGTYDVSLTITGVSGSSTTTKTGYVIVSGAGPTPTPTVTQTPIPGGNIIYLYSGWNFVSTPKVLADGANTAGVVFAGVNTAGHSIYLYDAGSGVWTQMISSSVVQPLDGIWIYSAGYKEVPLTFKNDPLQIPPTKQCYTGWNAIGFSDATAAAAKDDLISVKNQWTQAIGFSGSLQAYETSLINGGTGSHSDTNPMYPGKGYWLFMNSPGTLAAISA